jgi:muramoyltetrapeptide carboxypeptidase
MGTAQMQGKIKIGVVAPGTRIDYDVAERVTKIAAGMFGERAPTVHFHPQCFLSAGHFAGDDQARALAFLEIANDATFDALWIARGGYGSCRIAPKVLDELTPAARGKTYLGYSDAGTLLAGFYARGFAHVAHGPMPVDVTREDGDAAVRRALSYLVERAPWTVEPSAAATKSVAFNLIVLSQLIGTPLQPDLAGHVLMLEEVGEYMYRIDRSLCHVTSNPAIRRVAGIRLGRMSQIPPNDPDFGQSAVDVVEHWCKVSGIPYLGRADIGHDVDNKVVPFGQAPVA